MLKNSIQKPRDFTWKNTNCTTTAPILRKALKKLKHTHTLNSAQALFERCGSFVSKWKTLSRPEFLEARPNGAFLVLSLTYQLENPHKALELQLSTLKSFSMSLKTNEETELYLEILTLRIYTWGGPIANVESWHGFFLCMKRSGESRESNNKTPVPQGQRKENNLFSF